MRYFFLLFLLHPFISSAQVHYAGSLDSSFGANGAAIIANITANALVVTTDDKLLVAGADSKGVIVTRYNKDGNIDPIFCVNGTDHIGNVPGYTGCYATCILLQPDGKMVIGGAATDTTQNVYTTTHSNYLTMRLMPNGTLDTSFNKTGLVITDVYRLQDHIIALALQPDGKIITCGVSVDPIYGSSALTILIRYNGDGSLDTTFGNMGKLNAYPGSGATYPTGNAMFLQPDGNIVVGGTEQDEADFYVLLMRFNTNGTFDVSFGSRGVVKERLAYWSDGDYPCYSGVNAMQLLPDGKILAVGSTYGVDTSLDFALVKYNADGTRDTTFGNDGIIKTNIGDGDIASCIAIEPDGKIVVAGRAEKPENMQAIARYNPDGTPDGTFGKGGEVIKLIGTQNTMNSIQIQSSGKIVLAGNMQTSSGNECGLLVRYQYDENTEGSINTPGLFDFNIYPNPTPNGMFTISTQTYKGVANIQIIDMLGRKAWTGVNDFGTNAKMPVNIGAYAAGVYDVKIMAGTDVQVVKVVRE